MPKGKRRKGFIVFEIFLVIILLVVVMIVFFNNDYPSLEKQPYSDSVLQTALLYGNVEYALDVLIGDNYIFYSECGGYFWRGQKDVCADELYVSSVDLECGTAYLFIWPKHIMLPSKDEC
jgi:hypothetical protein